MTAPSKISGRLVKHIISGCESKARFSDEFGARAAGRSNEEIYGFKLYLYPCQICRGYHLTRSPQDKSFQAVSYDYERSAQKARPSHQANIPGGTMTPGGNWMFEKLPAKSTIDPSEDITGIVNGDLTAIQYFGRAESSKSSKGSVGKIWVCKCTCGMYTLRTARSLKMGKGVDMCDACKATKTARWSLEDRKHPPG